MKDWRITGLVIQIAVLFVAICRSILRRISSLEEEMLFQKFEKTFELCRKVAPHFS